MLSRILDRIEIVNNEQFQNLFKESINVCHNTIPDCTARIDWEQTAEFAEISERNDRQISITCENGEIGFTFQIIFSQFDQQIEADFWNFNCVYMSFPDDCLICKVDECNWGNGISEVSTWDESGEVCGIPLKICAAT